MPIYHERKSFTLPVGPGTVPCADGVHHYARGKCLRCDGKEPTWRPSDSIDRPKLSVPVTYPVRDE